RTPLSLTAAATSLVMFTKSIRAGTFIVRYLVFERMAGSLEDVRLFAKNTRPARSCHKRCECDETQRQGRSSNWFRLRDRRSYRQAACGRRRGGRGGRREPEGWDRRGR